MHLNQHKAADPDDVSNWIVKEYAEFLPQPLTDIINMSFKEKWQLRFPNLKEC